MTITKLSKITLTLGVGLTLAACGADSGSTDSSESAEGFDTSQTINVISREDGSGTRGAFTEITGVLVEEGETETDNTYSAATIQNSTSGVMTTVAGDPASIGYISLGSLDDSVKGVTIEGVEATAETVQDGSYAIARPFNVAYGEELSEVAQDFWDYIMSAEGQAVIEEEGYIKIDEAAVSFESNGAEGKVVVAGSSSVTPVMEKLKEAYAAVNTNVTIEINTSDSSTGVSSAIEGTCDIGMASRALKDSETSEGVQEITIAKDGIAVIVNNNNPVGDLTTETVKNIYVGDILTWSEI